MNTEEKAKAYDEALEKGRIFRDHLLETGDKVIAGEIEYIFPELVESKDEKIRKALIRFHKSTIDVDGIKGDDIIAWLEKQGESYTKKDVDDAYLKGICDAKQELEKQGKKQPIIVWHSINEEPEEMKELFCEWESDDATWHDVAFYDKESHTFRHAKMPINVTKWIYVDELLEKQGEQKPIDKVEPFDKYEGLTDFERTLADICIGWIGEELGWKQYIKDNADVLLKIAIKMFNSIQDAPFEQKPAWSDEDEIEIPFGAKDSELQEDTYYIPKGFHAEIDDDKVVIKKGEPQPAWSYEDENYLQSAENACEYQYGKNTSTILWLKSLKERITWKPSKEQMDALLGIMIESRFDYIDYNTLESLYNDLKKL